MLTPNAENKVYVQLTPVDMRKSINGLTALIVDQFSLPPQCGDIFIFYNKGRDKVKAVYWDRNGFVLHYKRLDKLKFKFIPSRENPTIEISHDQLQWLFAGLDFQLMNQFNELNYEHYY